MVFLVLEKCVCLTMDKSAQTSSLTNINLNQYMSKIFENTFGKTLFKIKYLLKMWRWWALDHA